MHRMVLRFVLPAMLLLAFGGPASTRMPAGAVPSASPAASPVGFTASALLDAAGSPAGVPFDFGRYGVLRLALRDSGVVTKDTRFTRTTASGVESIGGPSPRTLAGTVAGDEASTVRLTIARGWAAGFVFTGGRLLSIAPDDWNRPTKILVSEPEPAGLGVPAVGDEVTHVPARSSAAGATPTPTPTLTPPTPLPTLPPTPTPTPTTIATSIPGPTPPTLPSPFPVTVWPTLSPPPSPVPTVGLPEVSAGVYNCRVIRCNVVTTKVILDADATYNAAYGGACADRQTAILNMVDGIFMRPETRVHYVALQVNCRTVQAPLGGPGTSTAGQLDKVRTAWDGEGPNRSVVHLVVGYDFGAADGIGRAYLGGVCDRLSPDAVAGADVPEVLADRIGVDATPAVGPIKASISAGPVDVPDVRCAYGFSLYQGVRRPGTNYVGTEPGFMWLSAKISAHELGHNFNADHEPGSACPGSHTGTLMCEELQDAGPNAFSSNAAKRIREWAESKDGSLTGS